MKMSLLGISRSPCSPSLLEGRLWGDKSPVLLLIFSLVATQEKHQEAGNVNTTKKEIMLSFDGLSLTVALAQS